MRIIKHLFVSNLDDTFNKIKSDEESLKGKIVEFQYSPSIDNVMTILIHENGIKAHIKGNIIKSKDNIVPREDMRIITDISSFISDVTEMIEVNRFVMFDESLDSRIPSFRIDPEEKLFTLHKKIKLSPNGFEVYGKVDKDTAKLSLKDIMYILLKSQSLEEE